MKQFLPSLQAAVYAVLVVLGGFTMWTVAPTIDGFLFPVFIDEVVVPWDDTKPDELAVQQLDRVCWRTHVHKTRDSRAMRRSITIIAPDGTRYFTDPLDGRSGDVVSNKDAFPAGYDGEARNCTHLPDGFDTSSGYKIESYGQYLPGHGLWTIDHVWPIITVPPLQGIGP